MLDAECSCPMQRSNAQGNATLRTVDEGVDSARRLAVVHCIEHSALSIEHYASASSEHKT
jgi:hypothetical protein